MRRASCQMIAKDHAARARHVDRQNGRIAGNMPGHVPADRAREQVVAAADAVADVAGDGLAAIELPNGLRGQRGGGEHDQQRRKDERVQTRDHDVTPSRSLSLIRLRPRTFVYCAASGLMPALRITAPHLSISERICRLKSCGEPPAKRIPRLSMRSRTTGSWIPLLKPSLI